MDSQVKFNTTLVNDKASPAKEEMPAKEEETPVEDKALTVKEEKEQELNSEYIDNRSVTISLVRNYSTYRKVNLKVLGQRKDTIGSSISSSRTLASNKGEIEAYFPNILGISSNHPDFIARVKHWLNNIQVIVSDDLTLNTTFVYEHKSDYLKIIAAENRIESEFDKADRSNRGKFKKAIEKYVNDLNSLEGTKYKYGRPQDVTQYLIYRHCLLYKDVAKDLMFVNSDPSIRFYIKNEAKERAKQIRSLNARKKAKTNYVEMVGDSKKLNAVFIQYCVYMNMPISLNIIKSDDDKELLLDTFSNENPDKFNKIFEDRQLMIKSFIETLIAKGELIRSEFNQNISTSNGEFIGANMNEAIAFFNNPANADVRKAYENKIKFL